MTPLTMGVSTAAAATTVLGGAPLIFEHIVDPSMVFVHKVFSDSALGDDTSTYISSSFLFNWSSIKNKNFQLTSGIRCNALSKLRFL